MKTLLLLLSMPLFGGCLVLDSLTVTEPACANSNCQTGPGIVTSEQFKAAVSYQFHVEGHSLCKTKAPAKGSWVIEIAFYDKDQVRLGIYKIAVASLLAGEKFRHVFEIPGEVLATGIPKSAKVRTILESPDIN